MATRWVRSLQTSRNLVTPCGFAASRDDTLLSGGSFFGTTHSPDDHPSATIRCRFVAGRAALLDSLLASQRLIPAPRGSRGRPEGRTAEDLYCLSLPVRASQRRRRGVLHRQVESRFVVRDRDVQTFSAARCPHVLPRSSLSSLTICQASPAQAERALAFPGGTSGSSDLRCALAFGETILMNFNKLHSVRRARLVGFPQAVENMGGRLGVQ